MRDKLADIKNQGLAGIAAAKSTADLMEIRSSLLGKKGSLTQILRSMGAVPAKERPAMGQLVNEVRTGLETELENKQKDLEAAELESRLEAEAVDISLPGRMQRRGTLHPLTLAYNELTSIFIGMGFEIKEGPEVELDKYNFEMLNIPKGHAARDAQDSFYINENVVLRTQTSPVQVRTMLEQAPPIYMISPGRVYRSDDVDATHSPIFNQLEGLVVDKGITMGDLRGTLDILAKGLFNEETKTRLRPSYFPFTEPSAELDVSCAQCGGSGCRVCKHTGWIEVLGCGMVNPAVLIGCGIDPEVYSGFAFGMGLERIANTRFGISDIRLLYENDMRFLSQF
ncbi:MAG: phenylalanine--tRNA ligase subunit alpha [Christensenellales bacterium]